MILNFGSVDTYIPSAFKEGRLIEQIILVCDVDGVVRHNTDADIDPRVLTFIKDLVHNYNVDVAFISGTPVSQDKSLEIWRRGNIALDQAIGSYFIREIQEERVTVYGALGGQRLTRECEFEIIDAYSLDLTFEVSKLLLGAFLKEVQNEGNQQQRKCAERLEADLNKIILKNRQQVPEVTVEEFGEIVSTIRSEIDPHFRLVSYGTFVESQTSNPPWNTDFSSKWIQNQVNHPDLLLSQLPEEERHIATGLAHRGGEGFNFLMISKSNKSITMRRHIQEKILKFPDALIVTIGDTQVDFPMHKHAHLAYHVGKEEVWKNNYLPQCILVRDESGRDRQHVNGTLHILNLLKRGIGKRISDLLENP